MIKVQRSHPGSHCSAKKQNKTKQNRFSSLLGLLRLRLIPEPPYLLPALWRPWLVHVRCPGVARESLRLGQEEPLYGPAADRQ